MDNQNHVDKKRNDKRTLILQAAREIIRIDGMEKLSIRKIAKRINFTASNIYYYFHDKEDIVNNLMVEAYQKLTHSLASVQSVDENSQERLRDGLRKYIELALENPEEYMGILLNNSPVILRYTSLLFKGASLERDALYMLYQNIKEVLQVEIDHQQLEWTTQIIWTSTFGLIIKLILEKDISLDQRNRLIESHLSITIGGILALHNISINGDLE
jgi:AcrR family transcriptional regulator